MPPSLTKTLIDVAMGRAPADLVIRRGTWVCVQSGEFVLDTDVAIKDGRIAYVGPDASHTVSKDTLVMDAGSKYLVPGLLDGHMHVESGMLTVTEFVRAVIPELRISDKGLVDVTHFEFLPVVQGPADEKV